MKDWIKKYQTTLISVLCIAGILTAESSAVIGAFSCVLVYVWVKKIMGF
tara:strand:- start:93 stop:239 length:147 start_codon:yes stop_codon:yes gene_type:complete